MGNELESIAKELKLLAAKQFITVAELERAKALMRELKALGMTNGEISELTDSRWSESTVKGYTRGILAKPSSPWETATSLFSQMLSKGLTLKDIEDTIKSREQLQQQKTSITELASFVGELKAQEIDVAGFVSLYWDWVEAGLKAPEAASVLKLKGDLEGKGLGLGSLEKVASLATKFGDVDGILDAVIKYGSIVELEQERVDTRAELEGEKSAAREHLNKLDTEMATKQQTLQDLQAGVDEAKDALARYQSLVEKGFDLSFLRHLTEAAQKYSSPLQLLEAVNLFNDLKDIQVKCGEAKQELETKLTELNTARDNYSHLRTAVSIVEELMDKLGLNLSGISTILSTAEKYGDSVEVLKAVEEYGRLQTIREKTRQQELKVKAIETKIKTLQKAEAEVSARTYTALGLLESLEFKALEVGRVIGADEERSTRSRRFKRILVLLEDPTASNYEESAPHVLALANVLHTFVRAHKDKFITAFTITQALELLMKDLGKWQG